MRLRLPRLQQYPTLAAVNFMARYNHFSEHKYKQIMFSSIGIGNKFRQDFFKNRRRRADIICVKTSDLSYIEERSKTGHTLENAENYTVSSYV